MESAWEYYQMDFTDEGFYEGTAQMIWCASAVDEGARYILDIDDEDETRAYACMISRISLQP